MSILVVNAGSSSVKCAVFDDGVRRADAMVEQIGASAHLRQGGRASDVAAPDHRAALLILLDMLASDLDGFDGIGHRVVHGGEAFSAPALITPDTLTQIEAFSALAPLHNPHNLAAIRMVAELSPDLPQVACFDTAFHAGNPAEATTFALPADLRRDGLRRYGFHGLSYQGLVARLPISPRRLLALHLGNGASLCAIRGGQSVATTMGFSPLDGLPMGTRSGGLDPGAVLHLIRRGMAPDQLDHVLNTQSGLAGLSGGVSDMRALLAADDDAARFAVRHFCYWCARHAGSMIAAMGGIDAIAFTGGIGEHAAPVRAAIMQALDWTGLHYSEAANDAAAERLDAPDSAVSAWIIPADEEAVIAGLTGDILGAL